jgi:hypothetical protein
MFKSIRKQTFGDVINGGTLEIISITWWVGEGESVGEGEGEGEG